MRGPAVLQLAVHATKALTRWQNNGDHVPRLHHIRFTVECLANNGSGQLIAATFYMLPDEALTRSADLYGFERPGVHAIPRERKFVVARCDPNSQKNPINLLGKRIELVQIVKRLKLLFEGCSQHVPLIDAIRDSQNELELSIIRFGVREPITCLEKLFDAAPR